VEDLSDIEREEQLRKWWSENWLWIIGGIALGLAALAGWQYWQKQRYASSEAAASGYNSVLESLSRDERDQAAELAKDLRLKYPESPYTDQADLALARSAVERGEFETAAGLLQVVADGSQDAEMRLVARARLARVRNEQGKHDEAIATLDPAAAGTFVALYHDIRGDAFLAKGDAASARREFEQALAADGEGSRIDRGLVELKIEALPAATASEAAPQ
jgi:predicted negative regulator of RcsB-dependent stress response